LQARYRERKVTGGVFAVRNVRSGKILLESSTDLKGSKNRFDFSKSTGSCVFTKLNKDWASDGSEAFVFEILEELDMGEAQTSQEFKSDVELLKEIWIENLSDKEFY